MESADSLSAGRAVSLLAALWGLTYHANPAGTFRSKQPRATPSDEMAKFPFRKELGRFLLYNKKTAFIQKGASNDSISLKSTEHTEQAPFQRRAYFKEKQKERSKIEAKNSEFKYRNGYDVATFSGLVGMEAQGPRAILTINLKRM